MAMAMAAISRFLVALWIMGSSCNWSGVDAQFFIGFYSTKNCANAEAIVTQAVTQAFNQDPSVAPSLIRMLFHDCFVEVRRCVLECVASCTAFRSFSTWMYM